MYVLGVFNEKLYLGFNLFVGLDIRANSTTGIFAEPVLSLQNGVMDGTFLPVLAGALVFLITIVLFDKKKVLIETNKNTSPFTWSSPQCLDLGPLMFFSSK